MLVSVQNLGCKVNRVESDDFIYQLESLGHSIVDAERADVVIVNTCSVTQEADKKTRKLIRQLASLHQHPRVYVTGCSAVLHEAELKALGDNVYVELSKAELIPHIDKLPEIAPVSTALANDEKVENKSSSMAFRRLGIKIQDGCDNRCSYCIIWKARGASRSVDVVSILSRIKQAVARGSKELVLTGINIGAFSGNYEGKDLDLSDLIELILEQTELARLRISSIEPLDVHEKLILTLARHHKRIASHIHMSLQSGSDATLREMDRIYTSEQFRARVEALRHHIPNIALSTDVIVGFPGESDKDFEESYEFCKEMAFSKIHVFKYSRREGTVAADRKDQLDPKIINERSLRMRELSDTMRAKDGRSRVGQRELVLLEHHGIGTTSSYHKLKLADMKGHQVGDLVLCEFDFFDEEKLCMMGHIL
ncbi:MAG: tRNA (N(6)-L-threonylcarbamoyladenosine(37)-C(2))-methylthiotransferase MtaB [Coriobacteriia bacterium]|nr:tRNA (N(6)-L-threonylcarbamoyladenosine(37)-C(2))-methylthiotransferase MtaB [Coriobacteriia bacterium]